MSVMCVNTVVHSQEMRGHGHPTGRRARRMGRMGSFKLLQQNLRWWAEIFREGMRPASTGEQRSILHRREKEAFHL